MAVGEAGIGDKVGVDVGEAGTAGRVGMGVAVELGGIPASVSVRVDRTSVGVLVGVDGREVGAGEGELVGGIETKGGAAKAIDVAVDIGVKAEACTGGEIDTFE